MPATTYTWIKSSSTTATAGWAVSGNWVHGANISGYPAIAGVDITIGGDPNLVGTIDATVPAYINYTLNNSQAYDGLVLNDPNATLFFTTNSNRTLNITNASTSTLEVDAGTLTFGNTTGGAVHTINTPNFLITGGTVNEGAKGIIASGTFSTGTLTLNGGVLNIAGGSVNDSSVSIGGGTISGFGTVKGSVTGTGGTIVATGGALEFTNTVSLSAGAVLDIGSAANSILKLDSAVGSGDTISFLDPNTGVLELANVGAIGAFNGTIAGLAIAGGNFINLQTTVQSIEVGNSGGVVFDGSLNTIQLFSGPNDTGLIGTLTLASAPTAGVTANFFADAGSLGGYDIALVCYAAGTLIETAHGAVPIEALAAGDPVVVLEDGQRSLRPVKWMGHRTVNLAAHPYPHLAAPVRIRQGALGEAMPRRDLLVSPAHGLFIDGGLVPANLLINHMTITQDLQAKTVTYYHLECEQHAIVLAEGVPAESYLDTGNRAFFENAALPTVLHPEFHSNAGHKSWETDACAPLVVDTDRVAPIWTRVAERARSLGFRPPPLTTTQDADVRLVADGRTLRPVATANGRYTFMVPAGLTRFTLLSRATAPADINPLSGDWRPLGVSLRTLTLRSGDDHLVIPADHPALVRGWHAAERDGQTLWRWTNGEATLPIDTLSGPAVLDIELGLASGYILSRSDEDQRIAA